MKVLLTGGAGYIGSHTAVKLLEEKHDVIIVDNYINSNVEVISRIEEISGRAVKSYEADVLDLDAMAGIFTENRVDAVIHFAGLKAVGESVKKPIEYYRNNLDATLTLLETMSKAQCKRIIFSSSAAVYGEEAAYPYDETLGRGKCSNPYGWTKAMSEQILTDYAVSDSDLSVVALRYFNPTGAHPSGLIGETSQGIPNNLMPYISQVASGKRDCLTIFGNDYPTKDGTCRRDYIHIMDLADAHVKALEFSMQNKGMEIFNIGTGTPYSVLEIVQAFEKVNNVHIKYKYGLRREGDLPECWANVDKANKILDWHATRSMEDMCRDSWNWQRLNPDGF